MKRRSFLELLLALAGMSFLPKAAAKPSACPTGLPVASVFSPGTPIGSMTTHLGDHLPNGWLPCDGRILARPDYPELWEAIGGADTFFQLPRLTLNVWRRHDEGFEGIEGVPYIIKAK